MPESMTVAVARAYLVELSAALTGVSDEVRAGILNGVREELDGLDAEEASRRVQELGDPQYIAAEARAEASTSGSETLKSMRDARWFSIIAALLVMVGGLVIPALGAIAGLIMVWFSHAWTRAEKWIATLIPVVLMALVAFVGIVVSLNPAQQPTDSGGEVVNPLIPANVDVMTMGILLILLAQVGIGIWLLVRARNTWARSASE